MDDFIFLFFILFVFFKIFTMKSHFLIKTEVDIFYIKAFVCFPTKIKHVKFTEIFIIQFPKTPLVHVTHYMFLKGFT